MDHFSDNENEDESAAIQEENTIVNESHADDDVEPDTEQAKIFDDNDFTEITKEDNLTEDTEQQEATDDNENNTARDIEQLPTEEEQQEHTIDHEEEKEEEEETNKSIINEESKDFEDENNTSRQLEQEEEGEEESEQQEYSELDTSIHLNEEEEHPTTNQDEDQVGASIDDATTTAEQDQVGEVEISQELTLTQREDSLLSQPEETPIDYSEAVALTKFFYHNDLICEKAMNLLSGPLEMQYAVSDEMRIADYERIHILFNGQELAKGATLQNIGISPDDTVAFEINLDPPPPTPPQEDNSPSLLNNENLLVSEMMLENRDFPDSKESVSLAVETEPTADSLINDSSYQHHHDKQQHDNNSIYPNESHKLPITIERNYGKKIFLGGYRHKQSGIEYHHAGVQTLPPPRDLSHLNRTTATTQTTQMRHQTIQSQAIASTQMTRPGVYISTINDRIVIPGPYETADEYLKKKEKKIITIQKYYRRWLAKRQVDQLRNARESRLNFEEEEQIRKEFDKQERIRKEFQRRMNPKTKQDFDLLFNALEKWRNEQMVNINTNNLTFSERKAALYVLLEQETELIHAIDRHQVNVSDENHDKLIQRLLGKAAAPKQWHSKKGEVIQMDTPYTLRGRELLEIYNSLQMKYLTQDERLDVLLTVKHTVKEHDCKLTMEIVELIDREVDLIMRGVKEDNLNGLRKRISNLFLQYCKTPTFNPEIARHLRVPQDPIELKNNVHYCSSCGRYLKSTEFFLGIKSTNLGRCKRCLRQDNLARHRQDLSTFKQILLELRKQEEKYHDSGRIAFLIEESDIRYLIENIWESMSILSRSNDLQDLVVCRWRRTVQWSPWNTILLTRDEADAHQKLDNVNDSYGDMLRHRVKQKHVLAQNYFSNLIKMASSTTVSSGTAGGGGASGSNKIPLLGSITTTTPKKPFQKGFEQNSSLPPIRNSSSGKVQ